ncbi:histidinol dehydrogenase [Thermogemmatispora sp.]|uniref:histidinol dehydrogenase n=1 Tax=Thermogemmatispora sp. TaxID=1968838 RepID=UPI001D6E0976|nr:histidinol dehydrogenase [Thermogemmatispora sp.]MBX5451096.1 histidinol dehydrogenase [Thermogemmatispora sp.]
MVHFYELTTMDAAQRRRLLRRAELRIEEITERVRPIIEDVRLRGDAALLEYTTRFDGVVLSAERLRVSAEEIELAHRQLDSQVRAALEQAIRNVKAFHQRQLPHEQWYTEVMPGVMAGERVTPISSVGLYVPRGKGAFPSVMYMLAAPASIAGVPRIVVCTPPGPDGGIDAASLVAADLCGVHEIYRVGGAQAIAALAYGTETIPRVHKIMGPGSGYVAAAKRLLYGVVDVGLPAGPSEAILLADDSADPELVARDLLIEAEHGPDSSSLLVTPDRTLAEAVKQRLPAKIAALPEWRRAFCRAVLEEEKGTGGIILTRDMDEAIAFVNEYAPEHLEVQVRDPFALLTQLRNAGEILIGPATPICLGNYCIGTNAILPTGGFAHTFSATSVHDFLKRTGVAYVTPAGYQALQGTARLLAEFEGFPAHAAAVSERPLPLRRAAEE